MCIFRPQEKSETNQRSRYTAVIFVSEGPESTHLEAPPTEPATSTEESTEEARKRKNREAVAKCRAKKKRDRASEAQAQEHAAIKVPKFSTKLLCSWPYHHALTFRALDVHVLKTLDFFLKC